MARLLSRRTVLTLSVLAAGSVCAAALAQRYFPFFGELPHISVQEAHRRAVQGEIILVDIRRPDEWRRTGIGEGAYPIDMRRTDFLQALARITHPTQGRPIALICASGIRSTRLAYRLSRSGFTNILNVAEGMTGSAAGPGWIRRNLPRIPFDRSET